MMRSSVFSLLAIGMLAACATDADSPTSPGTIDQIGAPSPVIYSPGTVTVQPTSTANVFTEGWLGFADRTGANGASVIGTGPASPPLGSGSLRIDLAAPTYPQTNTGWEIASSVPPVAAGTPLADITALSYATYTPSGQAGIAAQAIALQFNIDYDVTDSYIGYQGRLVFEPYHCNTMPLDAWNSWNTLDNSAGNSGCWWETANPASATRAPYVGDVQQTAVLPCPQGNPCTWDEVKANYPDAGFHPTNAGGVLILKAGSGWSVPSFFYTDALAVGVNGTTTSFDFEPATSCTTTCYVDAATGDDAFGGDTPTTAKKTIQAGVSAVSTGGQVIVAAGSYNEDVTISKALSLLGAGIDVSTVSGPIGGGVSTIRIAATGVIVDGFTVTRDGNNPTDWNAALNSAGVAVQGQTASVELRNSKLTGLRTGIDVNNSNGNWIHDNIIDNNRTGMIFRNQTDNTVVVNNFITNNWTVGVLFLDASSGTNVPVQTALNSTFSSNDLSGNWYGQVVDRQTGGALPGPGANAKNFESNWYGTTSIVTSVANSAEPGYSALIPVMFGGTAVAPGGQPDILGTASANVDFVPFLCSGVDTSPAVGFQPSAHVSNTSGACDLSGPISTVDASPAPINTAIPVTATFSELTTGGSDVVSYSWTIDGVVQATDALVASPAITVSVVGNVGASAVAAVKEVCFTAKDAFGNEGAPGCTLVVWYDPSAGFVTGGGWIDSPAGAYAADPLLSGRASFGFVSKYQKGKAEPTGNTSFQFKAAGLDFMSTSYDWLLISGARAQYQGSGTINGVGDYRFILTATDGEINGGGGIDRFRIRIWDSTNAIIYDNQAGDSDTADPVTAIGGGNIMIHKARK
ncbi:MAG TPA: right-handed parallel beta-helix repeat-containing protein [Gemmatimonadaceae bacterium]|nr:right-handed parallel beta-helix repeat-containing protein [Gemmatimonadaceae bacterium]